MTSGGHQLHKPLQKVKFVQQKTLSATYVPSTMLIIETSSSIRHDSSTEGGGRGNDSKILEQVL